MQSNQAAVAFGVLALVLAVLLGLLLGRRTRRLASAERTLAESTEAARRRLEQFLDAMPIGVFVTDADGHPFYANQSAERLLGQGVVPTVGAAQLAATYGAYIAGSDELYPTDLLATVRALRGEAAHIDDLEIRRPDATVPVEIWGTPVRTDDGTIEYAITTIADVSERRRAAEDLQLLSAITTNMAEGVALIQVSDGTIAYANRSLETMFGYESGEMVGMPIAALNAPGETPRDGGESPEAIAAAITRSVVETGRWEGEHRNIHKDGTPFWCALNVSAFKHQRLGPVTISVHTDITARKQAQEAQSQLASIVEVSHDAIFSKSIDGIITNWNAGAERMFGFTPAEIIGSPIDILVPAGLRDEEEQVRRRVALGVGIEQHETFRLRKDGTSLPVSVTLSPMPDAGGRVLGIAGIYRDMTERRMAEAAVREREELLASARDQALEASRLKSQFLANMSHEIRTPMNGVLGMTHILLQTNLDATQRRHVLRLRESGQNLLAVINDILDFSKVEAGKLELEETDFDLAASLESVMGVLASPANDKGLALTLDVPPDVPPWVRGDPVRLRQILINILGNAVKFTAEGSVALSVSAPSAGRLRFEVADTGIGIDPAARGRLLDPFSQADTSTTRRFGGTGLGLAICRQLVELMGGQLDFSSEVGVGSVFWFEIPMPVATARHAGTGVGPGEPGDTSDGASEGAAAVEPGTLVLLADDAELNLEVGRALLEGLGYQVDVVTNGVEAIEAVQRRRYAVILMDCLMPVMDGYEATAHIRRLEAGKPHTPIIALTAAAMSGDRERCLAAGMDDYVSKPLDPEKLAAALARCRPGRPPARPGDASAPDGEAERQLEASLRALGSRISPDAFERVLGFFLSQTPVLLTDLHTAIDIGDLEQIRVLAHKLKGSMASLGAERLSRLASEMEHCDPDEVVGLGDLAGRIDEEFERVRDVVLTLTAARENA